MSQHSPAAQNYEWAVLVRPGADGGHPEVFACRDAIFGCRTVHDTLNLRAEPQHRVEAHGAGSRIVGQKMAEGYQVVHGHWSTIALRLFCDSLRYRDPSRLRGESQELARCVEQSLGHSVVSTSPRLAPIASHRPRMSMS